MRNVCNHAKFSHSLNHFHAKRLQSLLHNRRVFTVRITDTIFIIPHRSEQSYTLLIQGFQPVYAPIKHTAFFHGEECGNQPSFFILFQLLKGTRVGNIFLPKLHLTLKIVNHLLHMKIRVFISISGSIIFKVCKAGKKLRDRSGFLHARNGYGTSASIEISGFIKIH